MSAARPMSLQEAFEEACPVYLMYGMTYHQYWNGDVYAHRAVRKAYKLKVEAQNHGYWLQGMYIYEALCNVAPILRAFSKANKPGKYPSEPYDLFGNKSEQKQIDTDRERYERIKEKVAEFAKQHHERQQNDSDGKEGDDGRSTGD